MLVLSANVVEVGGVPVRRALPRREARSVGPFVFLDQMGPATLGPGEHVAVGAHPHIGLATLTYLFDGALVHRDGLGTEQTIVPGDVNWMTAGRGLAHSERSTPADRETNAAFFGVQAWLALPKEREEDDPSFVHHPAASLPRFEHGDATAVLLAGEAWGRRSPVEVHWPTFYAAVRLAAKGTVALPTMHEQRALYVLSGGFAAEGKVLAPGDLAVFEPGKTVKVESTGVAHALLLGGAPLSEPRHMWWNFVHTDKARIEEAKRAWREGEFAPVPGERELEPLPER